MRNEILWEIAVQKALDSHLSDQPGDTSAVDILAKIASYGDELVDYDESNILVWEKFEFESGKALSYYIDVEARSMMITFTEVARVIKDHLVDLACEGKLDCFDFTTLDLASYVSLGISAANAIDDEDN